MSLFFRKCFLLAAFVLPVGELAEHLGDRFGASGLGAAAIHRVDPGQMADAAVKPGMHSAGSSVQTDEPATLCDVEAAIPRVTLAGSVVRRELGEESSEFSVRPRGRAPPCLG